MAFDGIQWQMRELSFGGLNQKSDDRARPQPFLDIAQDIQFDELGGIQPRFSFNNNMGPSLVGGGSLANGRRVESVNGELVVFTDTGVYSWNAQLSKFVLRGTHMAVAVDEVPRLVTTGDQIDGDRAELAGTIIVAWTEGAGVYVGAIDKTTGGMLVTPTLLAAGTTRPRVIALATVILVFVEFATQLVAITVNPAAPVFTTSAVVGAAGVFNHHYDVVKVDGQDLAVGAWRRVTTTSHAVFTLTPSLTLTTSVKARVCDGPIAIATIPGGTQTQVIRGNTTNIEGDLLTTSTLADVFTGQAVGTAASTTINQITVTFATSTTARAFWTSGSVGENVSFTDFTVKSNTVTTANAVGTQADFRHRLGIASHAFTYASHAYVWLVFAQESGASVTANVSIVRAQLQNTYFLYRDDGLLVGQCTKNVGGGFAPTTGRLPGVALTSGSTVFSWCATSRRRIELGTGEDHSAFGARSPRDVTFTFDDNRARRCARIGRTLYISGGIPLQYDGVQLAEVGFLNFPWYFEPQLGAAGNLGAGTYTWKATYEWQNAQGEVDRSTTATGMQLTIAASKFVFLNFFHLNTTLKMAPRPVTIKMWRTAVAPQRDSPFFLVTSQDPNASPLSDNGFVANDDTTGSSGSPLPDNFADATLTTKEENPENDGDLEAMAPPGHSIVVATDTRLYLWGVTGDADAMWYSRFRGEGEVVSFHDGNRAMVPRPGGDPTGLTIHNETPTVFRASAIYRMAGDGFNNAAGGSNFVAFRVSADIGAVNQESIASGPMGTIFKSSKGWYLLDPGWQLHYVGAAVSDFDGEDVFSIIVDESKHHVRIQTEERILLWDYLAVTAESPIGQWGQWSSSTGVHSTMWQGGHAVLVPDRVVMQQGSYAGVEMDVETAWIKPAGFQSSSRCRKIAFLGEYLGTHLLWLRVAYDYKQTAGVPDYVDSALWTPTPTVVGGPLQVMHALEQPICEAFKVRVTPVAPGTDAQLDTGNIVNFTPSIPVLPFPNIWSAQWRVPINLGETGNAVTMSVACSAGTPFSIDVRDHFRWDLNSGIWEPLRNNIGVHVMLSIASSPTVAQLEAAIAAGTALSGSHTSDPNPTRVLSAADLVGAASSSGAFSGGTFAAPSGAALKLTSLALDLGTEPGVFRRLPAAQQL